MCPTYSTANSIWSLEVYIHEDNYSWRCEIHSFSLEYRSSRSKYLRVRWTVDENENRKIKISNTVPLFWRPSFFRQVPIDSEESNASFYTHRKKEKETESEREREYFPLDQMKCSSLTIFYSKSLSSAIVFSQGIFFINFRNTSNFKFCTWQGKFPVYKKKKFIIP